MAYKYYLNIFLTTTISTVHHTTVETSKTIISGPKKRPSGEKLQKFPQLAPQPKQIKSLDL